MGSILKNYSNQNNVALYSGKASTSWTKLQSKFQIYSSTCAHESDSSHSNKQNIEKTDDDWTKENVQLPSQPQLEVCKSQLF